MSISPTTSAGVAGLAAITADPATCLAAFDYDGTLAPIVPDPTRARPHPQVIAALAGLAPYLGGLAVVTGRPAQVAVDLAELAGAPGLGGLVVVGHYGLERWDAATGELTAAEPPAGLDVVREQLPHLLGRLGLADAVIEDKGLSIAVHVRRMTDPKAAYSIMKAPLVDLAERHGLSAEPGRMVVELRPPGMDKGQALRRLVEEQGSRSVMFTGDDLGDLAAFDEVARLRGEGIAGLLVCSGSDEVTALADRADLVVDGPAGVAQLLDDLVAALDGSTS
ncbi:MAG: trehalose-phosphatase [Nocardioidaceae bacterium]